MILKLIRKFFYKDPPPLHIKSDSSANLKGCVVIVRKPVKHKNYLFVGKESVVQGQYVFERDSGKISIGENTFIGGGQFICIEEIEIGNDVLISWGCTFIDNDAHSSDWQIRKNDVKDWKKGIDENSLGKYKNWEGVKSSKITIGDRTWIGFNVIVLKGVNIGEGAVVGAGSVVTSDIPPFSIAAGNPAKIIKSLI